MGGCVEWAKGLDRKGYGRVTHGGRTRFVHRIAWESVNGAIPEGLSVLHRCDNPRCFNVAHLFVGTNGDNNRDMAQKLRQSNQNTWKTRCSKGHLLEVRNTAKRTRRRSPHRWCRTCALAADRAYHKLHPKSGRIRAQREEG